MKTAMQELIEKLSMKSGDSFYALAFYYDNDEIIKEALEKEREQLLNAFRDNDWNKSFNEYYNETYNQNK